MGDPELPMASVRSPETVRSNPFEGLLSAAVSGNLIRDLPDAMSTGDRAGQRQPAGTGW